TVIVNAASAALVVPSLTVITMPASVPTSPLAGVPLSCPLAMLKLAQLGLFWILKLSVLPLESLALGVNEYAVPACAWIGAFPLMVGGISGGAVTWMLNAGRATLVVPSLTLMTML